MEFIAFMNWTQVAEWLCVYCVACYVAFWQEMVNDLFVCVCVCCVCACTHTRIQERERSYTADGINTVYMITIYMSICLQCFYSNDFLKADIWIWCSLQFAAFTVPVHMISDLMCLSCSMWRLLKYTYLHLLVFFAWNHQFYGFNKRLAKVGIQKLKIRRQEERKCLRILSFWFVK
jgi:hypothetical protein